MKIWNVISGVASTLFIASILTFSFSTSITSANENPKKPCTGHHKNDDGCESGGGGDESGGVAPVVILESDAISNAVTLHWITPLTLEGGSDVATYEVWYSASLLPLNKDDFETGTLFERDVEIPAYDPGTPEYFTIRDLDVNTTYHFAVRAVDASGNASSLDDPRAFATVTTQSTATPSPGWQVDTVAELAIDNCCSTTSAQFDSNGDPIVAWVQHHDGPNTSGRIWYGYKDDLGDWVTEEAFVAGLCQVCYVRPIHDFKTIPEGQPGEETPTIPALLFSQTVSLRGTQRLEVVVYAYRQDENGWVTEEIVRGGRREAGELNGWDGNFSMDFFYVDNAWVPTAAYITALQYNDPITIQALMLAERHEESGQAASWNKTPALQCDQLDSTSGRMDTVRLRRGTDGSLHALVKMNNNAGEWGLIMHRPAAGEPWEYQRTGWLNTIDFAVDSAGNYYVVGKASEALYGQKMLILVEEFELDIPEEEACDPPLDIVDNYDIADYSGVEDTFANGIPEGPIVGSSHNFSAYGVYLTGNEDISPPAVHIFQISETGNVDVSEVRVLSRCAPGPVNSPGPGNWIRDAADRIHGDGRLDSGNFAVSENGIAWAYNYGRSRGRYDWKFEGPETVFLAQRTGNACQ